MNRLENLTSLVCATALLCAPFLRAAPVVNVETDTNFSGGYVRLVSSDLADALPPIANFFP